VREVVGDFWRRIQPILAVAREVQPVTLPDASASAHLP